MWMLVSLAVFLLVRQGFCETTTRLTNLQCETMKPSYAIFHRCDLKVIGRGIVAANVRMSYTYTVPKMTINLSLWKKFNGFRPFMYNVTFDFCETMKRIHKLSFQTLFLRTLLEKTNVNHSCPYSPDENLIVKDLAIKEEFLKYFPLPSGTYKLMLLQSPTDRWQTKIEIHFTRMEDLMKS